MKETSPKRFSLPDADLLFFPAFFTAEESDRFLHDLLEQIHWQGESIKIYGKSVEVPRRVAWYGEPAATYRYSGVTHEPEPWNPTLLAIKRRIEPVAGVTFNSVLLNLYRGERDSMGWHSDDEPELGTDPVIGSVSFGATRTFQLRHQRDKSRKCPIELTHGSFLLMAGPTQHHWRHQVPKSSRPCGPRVNLTFRVIQQPPVA
jgi:alkylated DNA repair dioxygenase AlkB